MNNANPFETNRAVEHDASDEPCIIIRRYRFFSFRRDQGQYDADDGEHIVWVGHTNPSRGECWLRIESHEPDDARLVYAVANCKYVLTCDGTDPSWWMSKAVERGLWLDDKFIAPDLVEKWMNDEDLE